MNSTWEIDNRSRRASKQKSDSSPLDLVKLGLKGLDSTINIIDDLLNAASIGTSSQGCNCGGNCTCECMDPMMECYSCGPLKSTTDLTLETRLGERRMLSFLVENNKEIPQTISVGVSLLMDSCGNTIDGGREIFSFSPSTFVIPECQCLRIRMAVNIHQPLQEGHVYYAEIRITGQCAEEKITLALYVQPDNYIDHFTLIDPCRPKKGKFVEFHNCDCGCCSEGSTFYICDATGRTFVAADDITTHTRG